MEKFIRICSFLFFLVSFLILCKVFLINSYQDFGVYYLAAKGINYPPLAIVFFSVLPLLPYFIAGKIWAAFSLIALFIAVYLIFRIYKTQIFSNFGLIILGLICLSFPVKFTLGMGQINNFILLIFVAAIYFLNQNKKYLSIFLFAFSFALKLFPSFLLFYFVLARKWKLLLIFIISLILLSLIALIFLGWQTSLDFYKNFLPSLISGWKTDYYNQALTGFIGRSFAQNIFSKMLVDILSLGFVLVSLITVCKSLKNKNLQNMSLGLLITLNLIVNNFSWQHHFVFLIFPFLATLFYAVKIKKNKRFLFLLFVSYVWVSFNLVNPHAVPIFLQSHVFYGAVLLWMLEVYLIWKDSKKEKIFGAS
jgi:hypothetical protein